MNRRTTLWEKFMVHYTGCRDFFKANLAISRGETEKFGLGVGDDQVRMVAASRKGPWALSNLKPLKIVGSNRFPAGRG
jgi:hypothetical protein